MATLLIKSRDELERRIDESRSCESSILLRYRAAIQFFDSPEQDLLFKEYLAQTSIREGARIVELLHYKGVAIDVMDETSLMATGSLKAIDGCLNAARYRYEGTRRILFESGGNTGSSFTHYGRKAGLETFFFFPVENLELLDSRLFEADSSHLIGVEDRHSVKQLATRFRELSGIRHVPDKEWRYLAAMFRGLFVFESMEKRNYDWLSQTVSAGFGPIGIYSVLETLRGEGRSLPRFLGLQQEANCPLVRYVKPAQLQPRPGSDSTLLSQVMYDSTPQTYDTFDDLKKVLTASDGDLLTVSRNEFDSRLDQLEDGATLLEALQAKGIPIRQQGGRILEKTGMIALTGTLKAIDQGVVPRGSRVLCCLTSGVSSADGRARPEFVARGPRDIDDYFRKLSAAWQRIGA